MPITEVHYAGQLAAVVTARRAIIEPSLHGRELQDVQAMCLYALTLDETDESREYTHADALAYSQHARAASAL